MSSSGANFEKLISEAGGVTVPSAVIAARKTGQSYALRDFISIKDFGAIGNGVHIDGPAIQEALEAAAAEFNGGGVVKVPPGTYLTEQTITPTGNVTLEGMNPISRETPVSIIKATNGSNLNAVIASPNWIKNTKTETGQTTCRWLGVDGNKTNQTGGEGHGIVLACYRGSAIECAVFRPKGDGIRITNVMQNGTTEFTTDIPESKCIRNVVYNMGKHGISIIEGATPGSMTDGFMIENVCYTEEATSHEGDGIHMAQSGGWLVQGNHCYGLGRNNIYCALCTETSIIGNYLDGWGAAASVGNVYGLYVEKSEQGVTIMGNRGSLQNHTLGAGNTFFGIGIKSASTGTLTVAVMGNVINGPGSEGTGLRVIQEGTAEVKLAKPPNSNQFRQFATNVNVDPAVQGTNDPRPEPVTLTANAETYTVPATVTALRIIGMGNGGGGGQGGGGFTTAHAGGGGGGGGGGGVIERVVTGLKPGTVLTANIPAAAAGGSAAGVGGASPSAGSAGTSGSSSTLTGTNSFATITALGGGGGGGGGAASAGATGAGGTCGNYGSPGNGANSNVIACAGVGGAGGSSDANASGTHGGSPAGFIASGGGGAGSGGATEAGNGGKGGSAQAIGEGGASGGGAAASTAGTGTNGAGGGAGGGGAVNGNGKAGAAGATGSWIIMPLT